MERLAAHGDIGAYGELLLQGRRGWPDWPAGADDRPFYETYLLERSGRASRRDAHRWLFPFLDWLYEPRRGLLTIGFKLMYDEAVPYPELLVYLRRRRVRVLHLVRDNLLDVAISQMGTAVRTRVHAWSERDREDVAIPVDVDGLLWWLRRLERERRRARRLSRLARLTVHDITYEDLVSDDALLSGVLEFLGVASGSPGVLPSSMVKLAPLSHSEGMANYEDVERRLRGTRFARYLRP
jgi:hypothetical protein